MIKPTTDRFYNKKQFLKDKSCSFVTTWGSEERREPLTGLSETTAPAPPPLSLSCFNFLVYPFMRLC